MVPVEDRRALSGTTTAAAQRACRAMSTRDRGGAEETARTAYRVRQPSARRAATTSARACVAMSTTSVSQPGTNDAHAILERVERRSGHDNKSARDAPMRHRDAGELRRGNRAGDPLNDLEWDASLDQPNASSPPRPNTKESPPFSRTTRSPCPAHRSGSVGCRSAPSVRPRARLPTSISRACAATRARPPTPGRRAARHPPHEAAVPRAWSGDPDGPAPRRRATRSPPLMYGRCALVS